MATPKKNTTKVIEKPVVEEVVAEVPSPAPAPAPEITATDKLAESLEKLADSTKTHKIKFDSGRGYQHRFSILKDPKTGRVFTKNNVTGKITEVQQESLEEKKKLSAEGLEEA